MPDPVVTALRPERRGRVLVELDGDPWRALPEQVVARTLLHVGARLDRPRLRELRRELRRAEALGIAARALRYRDLSERGVEERLERAGVTAAAREEAVETLGRIGYVDDRRFGERRAQALAAKGWGDAAIAADLERQGVGAEPAREALAGLEPERERALRIAASRGGGRATAAYLARRGFGEDALEAATGRVIADEG